MRIIITIMVVLILQFSICNSQPPILTMNNIKMLEIINLKLMIQHKILLLKPNIDKSELNILVDELYKIDKKENIIDSDLMIALIYVESRFVKKAKSRVGAIGYCQINSNVHDVPKGNKKYDATFQLRFSYNYLNTIYSMYQKNNLNNTLNYYNGRVKNNNYYKKVLNVKYKLSLV